MKGKIMLISKINFYTPATKILPTKQGSVSFKGNIPEPKKCFELSSEEFHGKYGGYKAILTQNQIKALKKMSEHYEKKGVTSNLAVAFFPDPVADIFVATSQDDLIKGSAKWQKITDFSSL